MTLFTAGTLSTCDVENLKYFCEVLSPRTEKNLGVEYGKDIAKHSKYREREKVIATFCSINYGFRLFCVAFYRRVTRGGWGRSSLPFFKN